MKILSKMQLILLVLVLTVAFPVASYAVDGKIKIGQTPSTIFPIVISESGSYILTSNLTVSTSVNCIEVTADNVTLDLNGFALVGPGTGSGGRGIYVNSVNNVSVGNGTVRNFVSTGIDIPNTSHNCLVKDIRAYDNGVLGIRASYSTVINCIAEKNGLDGIYSYHSTVKDCASNDNGDDGIYSFKSTINYCQCYGNANRGIYAQESTITNCTITGSGSHGIEANSSTLTNCTSNGNSTTDTFGILLTDSIATNCSANKNNYGIQVTNSTLTNCTANMNDRGGFWGHKSTLTNCTANSNFWSGITLVNACVATNCTANDTGRHGFWAYTRNRIEGNNVRNNGQSEIVGGGIFLDSNVNYVIKNTASENYSGNFLDNNTSPYPNYMPLTGDNANYDF